VHPGQTAAHDRGRTDAAIETGGDDEHDRKKGPTMASRNEHEAPAVGDRLVVRGHHQGEPERDAEILEVLGTAAAPHYRVRWQDDGHVSILYPGADAFIQHLSDPR
jgi:hypothetical protein